MKLRDDMPLYVSGLAGALALAVSTYNVYLQRAQVRAQVWPHLEWSYDNSDEGFAWNIDNVGVGPALLKGARATVDGKPVKSMWEAIYQLRPELEGMHGLNRLHSSFAARVMPAGSRVHPIQVERLPSNDPLIDAQAKRFSIEICYCSTLAECWIMSSTSGTVPIGACPAYPPLD
jgi:hypothetical protein